MDLRTTLQRADALQKSGKLAEAEQLYLSIADGKPGLGNDAKPYADAVHNAGVMAAVTGRHEEAIRRFDQALALRPREPAYRRNLVGTLVNAQGPENMQRAYVEAQRALRLAPDDVTLLQLFATAAQAVEQTVDAAEAWKRLADLAPREMTPRFNAGLLFQQAGNQEAAIECYRKTLVLNPHHVQAMSNLASLLGVVRGKEETYSLLQQLEELGAMDVTLKPLYALLLMEHGQIEQGEKVLAEGEDLTTPTALADADARDLRTLPYLFAAHSYTGRVREAVEIGRRYCARLPSDLWGSMSLLATAQYLHPDDPAEHLRLHQRFEADIASKITPLAPAAVTTLDGRRLRVGYVSGDLREHSVGLFIEPLVVNHNSSRVEVHLFSTSRVVDARSERLKATAYRWHDVAAMSDEALASLVRTLQIDVLIDLSGHTEGARLTMFAFRPAPVQLTYLGYSSTTGTAAIDGLITDPVCDPPGNDAHFTERLLRLPHVFAVYRPPCILPDVTPPPAAATGHVTLATVAAIRKINDGVLDAWSAGMRGAPTSRLMLIGTGFDDPSVQRRFRTSFERCDIDPERLSFFGRLSFERYIAMHANIDLMLDTFPFTGHTTTVQNLWMGVPVVTFAGQSHRSRMGASVLASIGLTDLIAHREEDYGPLIGRWASDAAGLAALRAGMRERMMASPLMDEADFARSFEDLLFAAYESKRQQGHV